MQIKVYTDGGLSAKNEVGGWAAVIVHEDGTRKAIQGHYKGADVTNNKMELTAVIEALKYLAYHHEGQECEIVSDSEYIVKGVTEWAEGWIRKGWKSTTGPVKNQDYWKQLLALNETVKPKFSWVRGHDGDENNELADSLAVSSYKKIIDENK
mgnify:CR=1 FL=1